MSTKKKRIAVISHTEESWTEIDGTRIQQAIQKTLEVSEENRIIYNDLIVRGESLTPGQMELFLFLAMNSKELTNVVQVNDHLIKSFLKTQKGKGNKPAETTVRDWVKKLRGKNYLRNLRRGGIEMINPMYIRHRQSLQRDELIKRYEELSVSALKEKNAKFLLKGVYE